MIQVYSKNNCPYCDMAKRLLDSNNVPYEVINIEENTDGRQFLAEQNLRSVPQIYNNGTLIGGFDKLKAWFELREITL